MDPRHKIVENLQYHVIFSSPITQHLLGLQNDLYDFWYKEWLQTFQELKEKRRLFSDDFLRQESTFFTYENEIVAYFGFGFFNLNLKSHREHSYFQYYPLEAIEKLRQINLSRVMTMGNFAVARKLRKSSHGGLLIAELLGGLAYKRFLDSNADSLIAYTRNNRKVNEMAYRYGSRCLVRNLMAHNVEVDIIYTLRNELKENSDPFLAKTIRELWQNRIIHTDEEVVKIKKAA